MGLDARAQRQLRGNEKAAVHKHLRQRSQGKHSRPTLTSPRLHDEPAPHTLLPSGSRAQALGLWPKKYVLVALGMALRSSTARSAALCQYDRLGDKQAHHHTRTHGARTYPAKAAVACRQGHFWELPAVFPRAADEQVELVLQHPVQRGRVAVGVLRDGGAVNACILHDGLQVFLAEFL